MGGSPSKDTQQMQSRDWNGAGKVAIVTGPTGSGIGLHTARWLAERGAHVVLAGRNPAKLKACEEQIRSDSKNADGTKADVQLTSIELDLSSLKSVESFAEEFKKRDLPLHMLINNAGVMSGPYTTTQDGFELQFGTNHIGHHYLTTLLLDKLKASAPSRVVCVSSRGHMLAAKLAGDNLDLAFNQTKEQYGYMGRWTSYGNSKLGNILLARSINSKYAKDGVTAYSLHPGVVKTELGRQGWAEAGFYKVFGAFCKDAEEGAGTTVYCATSPEVEKDAGKFFDKCEVSQKASKLALDDQLAEAFWQRTEQEIAKWRAKQQSGEGAAAASAAPAAAASAAEPAAEEKKQ